MSTLRDTSFVPPDSLQFFFGRPTHFFTLQNFRKIVNGSHHFLTFPPFSHYFYSTISILYIKNQWVPPLHPLYFLFSTTLYILLNLRSQIQYKLLGETEGVERSSYKLRALNFREPCAVALAQNQPWLP